MGDDSELLSHILYLFWDCLVCKYIEDGLVEVGNGVNGWFWNIGEGHNDALPNCVVCCYVLYFVNYCKHIIGLNQAVYSIYMKVYRNVIREEKVEKTPLGW